MVANLPALKTYGRDLVEQASKLDPVIGRDEEIRRVVSILSRRTKNSPVLVGEPGVGKTAVVEGLAQRIMKGDVPSNLTDVKLIALDMCALVAGPTYKGEFEERVKSVLKEVEDAQGKVVLFIDEIHMVLGDSTDAATLLARGQLRCIGATTLPKYRKYAEKDAAFERKFQQVLVAEPSVRDTINILRGLKKKYEGHHGVRIQDRALVVSAQFSARYITGRHLPDKAIDLVDEACANVRVQLNSQPEEIDNFERKRMQLEIELQALEKDKDKARLVEVWKELDDLKDKLQPLTTKYRKEKEIIDEIRRLKQKREELTIALQEAEKQNDLPSAEKQEEAKKQDHLPSAEKQEEAEKQDDLPSADKQEESEKQDDLPSAEKKEEAEKQDGLPSAEKKEEAEKQDGLPSAADLRRGEIKEVESAIAKLQESSKENVMLRETVGPEHIAAVVSRRTKIPVTRLDQNEKDRLLSLADRLHQRVVGQDHAVNVVAEAIQRSRAGLEGHNNLMALSSSSVQLVSAKLS
ncbi:unnamed protein product [Microthlaspi erraticum]|uniref:AAA+ ATPase domain-containing protein n=1 Tax=Microthlaspi erraticum TaxID=1685480 RepID=A0A6D2K7P5_9BRAS|nr:unnamed protein product [Microthlaspi erraticum]CAA7056863.1 unnamed protein product [Microthlaspi erraticum]